MLGLDRKRFDFVVETSKTIYFIEVNFYNSNGSKPNEVARAYSELSPKINSVEGCKFIWITDGQGWLKTKKTLEEAYLNIPFMYNLTTLSSLINEIKDNL